MDGVNVDAAFEAALKLGGVRGEALLQEDRVIPTGIWSLDWALLQTGGIPVGRQVEMFGEPSSGKSLVLYRMVASAQRAFPDKYTAILDTEQSLQDRFGVMWMERQGVDLSKVSVFNATTAKEVFNICLHLVQSRAFSLIGVDSMAEVYPDDMLVTEKRDDLLDWGNIRPVAIDARAMTEFQKPIHKLCRMTDTTLVWINQLRDKIGGRTSWGGDTYTTPGGYTFRYNQSVRLYLWTPGDVTETVAGTNYKEVVGRRVSIKVVKSKIGPHGGQTGVATPKPLEVVYGEEDVLQEGAVVLRLAVSLGIVSRSGAWYSFLAPGEDPAHPLKAQGEDNFAATLHATAYQDGWSMYGLVQYYVEQALRSRAEIHRKRVEEGEASEESAEGEDPNA